MKREKKLNLLREAVDILNKLDNHLMTSLDNAKKRDIGHWEEIDEKSALCSCCMRYNILYGDFCKWCGAKMVEPQESEARDADSN